MTAHGFLISRSADGLICAAISFSCLFLKYTSNLEKNSFKCAEQVPVKYKLIMFV